jgi:hypothetical protein
MFWVVLVDARLSRLLVVRLTEPDEAAAQGGAAVLKANLR